jgi:hypothetical protein
MWLSYSQKLVFVSVPEQVSVTLERATTTRAFAAFFPGMHDVLALIGPKLQFLGICIT